MKKSLIVIIVINLLTVTASFAQDTLQQKWHYNVEPYMMFPNMTGQTTVANLPEVGVDANVGDIFGHLKMGAMLYAEATGLSEFRILYFQFKRVEK